MSVLATLISSITFLAYPGEGFAGNWIRLVQGLAVPLVLIVIVWFIVPMYRQFIGLSAYEYFEKRFGYFGRLYSSLAFIMAWCFVQAEPVEASMFMIKSTWSPLPAEQFEEKHVHVFVFGYTCMLGVLSL